MSTFRVVITSPDGNFFDGEAEMLTLRGADGDLAVLAGHAPFITSVQHYPCKIILPDGRERIGKTEGGILTVSENTATLLTGAFSWQTEEK